MESDYIVVGAGSAGCAVAHELANAGRTVRLIEAGGLDRSPFIRFPAGIVRAITHHDWGYQSAPDSTRNQKSERWYRGRVVGGSSSINGMIYVRGAACDYDRWLNMGNVSWGSESVMSLFSSIERCDAGSIADPDRLRGREGPVHVRMVKDCHPVTEAFVAAAQSAGCQFIDDYNGATQQGVGYTQMTQRRGRRWSAADAFLKPVLGKKNLELVIGAQVDKVLVKERRAYGVVYERAGVRHEARARHVILCGGAINTPKLLMLSGIGDAAALAGHGIDVVLDRKSVGQGLMEHSMVRLIYRMNVPTHNFTGGLLQKIGLLAKYLYGGQGLLASTFEAMVFLKTSPSEQDPDVQLHFAPVGIDAHSGTNALGMLPYPSVLVSVKKNYPVSRGRVGLASKDSKVPPVIDPRLLASEKDVETLVQGIAAVRRIMSAAPIAKLVAAEERPGHGYTSAESIAAFVRDNTTIAYHPAGTCRMGVDEEAVVTPQLQVRGLENLWIADASIMPDHISGNTNAVCMMIGAKLGRQLSGRAQTS